MNWLSTNWPLFAQAFTSGHYFEGMTNQLGLAITAGLIVMAIFSPRMRKPVLMFLIAMWGYTTVYHFTLEGASAEFVGEKAAGNISNVGNVAVFVIGCVIVSASLLYYFFVKD